MKETKHNLMNKRHFGGLNLEWDITVGVATGQWTGRPEGSEFESRQGQDYSFLRSFKTVSGAHPVSCAMRTGGSSPGVNGRDMKLTTYHLTSVEIKNTWMYTSN
jgi:hypothetical protein